MSAAQKCWICNRSSEEVANALSGKLSPEVNVEVQASKPEIDSRNLACKMASVKVGSAESEVSVCPACNKALSQLLNSTFSYDSSYIGV